MALAEAAARQPTTAQASSGQRPDEDAAAAAADAALHSRHRAGRARLFPDAAVLAGRLRRQCRQPGPLARRPLRRRARARICAARCTRRRPSHYPEVGLYHPRAAARIVRAARASAARAASAGTVGLLVMRSYVLAGNTAHYDGVIAALEARACASFRPSPAASTRGRRSSATSCKGSRPIGRRGGLADRLLAGRRPRLQRCAGGRGRCWRRSTCPTSPRIRSSSRRCEQWQADARGLMPVEATMMVAIPELDGATGPMMFGGRSSAARRTTAGATWPRMRERAAMLAARVAKLVALRRSRACRAQDRSRAVQLPAQCRQHRHGGLSVGLRVAASTRCWR